MTALDNQNIALDVFGEIKAFSCREKIYVTLYQKLLLFIECKMYKYLPLILETNLT